MLCPMGLGTQDSGSGLIVWTIHTAHVLDCALRLWLSPSEHNIWSASARSWGLWSCGQMAPWPWPMAYGPAAYGCAKRRGKCLNTKPSSLSLTLRLKG
eukprot:9474920-Pyramimonas_sp.AAC.2